MSRLSPTAQGIALMVSAIFLFSCMDALAKSLAARYDVLQIVWARYAGQMLAVIVVLWPRLLPLMRTRHIGLQLLRSGFLFAATFVFFTSFTLMPIASATAVFNIHPMLLAVGAAVILGEPLGQRRLAGLLAALLGAILILQPGAEVFSLSSLLPLLAGLCYAAYALTTRFLGRDEPVLTSFIYTAAIGTVAASLMVPAVWVAPGLGDIALFTLLGMVGAAGQYLLIRALTVAEAGAVAPFGYTGILFSTVWGIALFAEIPNTLSILGALVIIGAGVYVWHAETRSRRGAAS